MDCWASYFWIVIMEPGNVTELRCRAFGLFGSMMIGAGLLFSDSWVPWPLLVVIIAGSAIRILLILSKLVRARK